MSDDAKRPEPPAELWGLEYRDGDGWRPQYIVFDRGCRYCYPSRGHAEKAIGAPRKGWRAVLIGVSPARLAEAERERGELRFSLDRMESERDAALAAALMLQMGAAEQKAEIGRLRAELARLRLVPGIGGRKGGGE